MRTISYFAAVFLSTVATNTVLGFIGSMDCPNDGVCFFSRGHYHLETVPSGPTNKYFKVFEITKDYTTTFDITFIVKNIKNLDSTRTMLSVGVKNAGPSNQFHYKGVTSTQEKIFHFRDVTMARIALLSFQEGVTADAYYFMDCGFQMRQFARIDYPEQSPFMVPILKMFGAFGARQIVETASEKTCWLVIPKDSQSGWDKVETTYILMNNASLAPDAHIQITNVITKRSILSYPDGSVNNDIAVSEAEKNGNVSVETDTGKSLATAVFFVDLVCMTPWNPGCKRGSRFRIMFKPLTQKDKSCLQTEDYCKFGFGGTTAHHPMCKLGERIPSDAIFSSHNGLASTTCPGVNDLLNAVSLSWVPTDFHMRQSLLSTLTGNAIAPHSQRRMGTVGMCTDWGSYCSSIRTCSHQSSCGYVCLMCHVRGICSSIEKYFPYLRHYQ